MTVLRALAELALVPLQLLLPEPALKRIGVPSFELIRRRRVLAHLRGNVLDVACGQNRLVSEHRARGGRGFGSDIHAWDGVDVVADAAELPFPDQTFDSVVIVAALNHIPRRAEALAEAARILRPEGRVIITMIGPLVGRLNHGLAWCDPDLHERGMGGDEVHGLTREGVLGLADRAGLRCSLEQPFVAGLNRLYVLQRV